jgi:hypothetical protein
MPGVFLPDQTGPEAGGAGGSPPFGAIGQRGLTGCSEGDGWATNYFVLIL